MAAKDKAGITGKAKSKQQSQAFASVLEDREPEVQKLAREARKLILEVMPGVIESVWPHQGTCSYGTGPKKMSEHFIYFTFAKKHLSLGFYYGAELKDPAGLLEGSGKKMRRVVIKSLDQLKQPELKALIERASTHRVPPLP